MDGWSRYQLRRQIFAIGEDFWIENERGEQAYKVDGKALRIRETFVLEDRTGAELATIERKLLALMPTMTIQRGGQPWAVVKKIPFTFLHQEFEIDVQGGGMLRAKGEITNHEYQIVAADQPVAVISKAWFALRETYGVAIAPGQDEALLLAVAVCVDELSEQERQHGIPGLPGLR
jgi:uncharacterized protein YxjI